MYILSLTPDKKCSKCGAINQTESIRNNKGFGRTTVVLRCTICGHEKKESEENYYHVGTDTGYHIYSIPVRPEIEEF